MRPETITISSRIDTAAFQKFAIFETFTLKKRHKLPLIFAVIMLAFAGICFALQGQAEQASLLGSVLAGIGVLLPFFYFWNYFASLRQQAKKLKLEPPKHVYTVSMTAEEDGITIVTPTGEGGTLRVKWVDVDHVYRVDGCIYFFLSARQAFLLPDGQANVTADELWEFLEEQLPDEKLSDRRK